MYHTDTCNVLTYQKLEAKYLLLCVTNIFLNSCLLIWTTWSFKLTGFIQGSTSCAFICEVRHTVIRDAFSFNITYMGKLYATYLTLLFIQCRLWQYCLLSKDSLKNHPSVMEILHKVGKSVVFCLVPGIQACPATWLSMLLLWRQT